MTGRLPKRSTMRPVHGAIVSWPARNMPCSNCRAIYERSSTRIGYVSWAVAVTPLAIENQNANKSRRA